MSLGVAAEVVNELLTETNVICVISYVNYERCLVSTNAPNKFNFLEVRKK